MVNPVRAGFDWAARTLASAGLIDGERGQRIADLAWPRFLTMFARNSQRVADIAMVGLAVGPTAIAGLAFANVFWSLGNGFSLGLAGGTISQVSQRFGSDRLAAVDLATKQSAWVGVAIALPFTLAFWFFAEPLIELLAMSAAAVEHGAIYLQVLSVAMIFNFLNTVSSRALAGADDTWIAMSIRATGAFSNIVLNAVFIFGLGMGAMGAALGTVVAEGVVTLCFVVGFTTGRLPVIGAFPFTMAVDGPYVDWPLVTQLLTITPPLMVRRVGRTLGQFPLLAMIAVFGPVVVAGFEVGRRVRLLLKSSGAGFSMAASSLVGQALGRGDEHEAQDYSTDIIRFSGMIYVAGSVIAFVFADPIARVFVDSPDALAVTTTFVRIGAISFVGLGMDYTFTGILKAAGDNRWPLYGHLVGMYALMLPVVYIGTITPLGTIAVFIAMVAETWSTGLLTGYRYRSRNWLAVSRRFRPTE